MRDAAGAWRPVRTQGPAIAAHPRFPELGVVIDGKADVETSPGARFVVDRGTEYETVSVAPVQPRHVVRLRRWINPGTQGWWPGDLHVHREPAEVPLLMKAAGIAVAPTITRWNDRRFQVDWTEGEDQRLRLRNAEDERQWGAALFLGLRRPIELYAAKVHLPAPTGTWTRAREEGAYIDLEKPTWWAAPLMVQAMPPDSIGIAHNHFLEEGMYEGEAWGRPRDRSRFPGHAGYAAYVFELYARMLGLGRRIPASAGSANGVLKNPVGYNRSYVYLARGFNEAAWWAGQKAGRNFVTNGPMLFLTVDGQMPGDVLPAGRGLRRARVDCRARTPLKRVDVVANGLAVKIWDPGRHRFEASVEVPATPGGWIAARCLEQPGEGGTIRFAHTSPVYEGTDARRDPESVAWLGEWIAAYRERLKAYPETELSAADREAFLGFCDRVEAQR